jgi:hypothetical protein
MAVMETATYDPTGKAKDAFNSANHDYLASGAGAVPQFVANRLKKEVWVTDYGAIDDGATDCRPAIEKAIQAGGLVRFPPGVFLVGKHPTKPLGIELTSNTFLVGAGQGATVIKAKDTAGTMHLVATPDGASTSNIGIRDLTLDHNGQSLGANAGVHTVRLYHVDGFYMRGVTVKNSDQHGVATLAADNTSRVNKNIFISDIYLENIGVSGRGGGDGLRLFYGAKNVVVSNIVGYGIEYHGIHVAYGAATVTNVILYNVGNAAISAQSDGVVMSNIHVEWEADHLICDTSDNRPAAGVFGRHFYASNLLEWYYDNGSAWKSASSNPTGLWSITRDVTPPATPYPPGGRSHFSNIKIVMNITENTVFAPPSGDGFRLDTDYSNADNIYISGKFRFGAYITGNNNNSSNITINGCREDGIRVTGGYNILDGWRVVTANLSMGANNRAVRLSNGVHNKAINGYALDSVRVPIAIAEEGTADYSIITGNDVVSYGSTKISSVGANSIIRGNIGYKTEAKGTATIVSGNTSVNVAHGLSRVPNNGSIMVTPTNKSTNNPGRFWISAADATNFTISCESNPGASGASFAWNAEIL